MTSDERKKQRWVAFHCALRHAVPAPSTAWGVATEYPHKQARNHTPMNVREAPSENRRLGALF